LDNILHITNGDSAVNIMKEAAIAGDFLAWRDVLHDGPVPDDLRFEELLLLREKFIIGRGWGTADNIRGCFDETRNTLKSIDKYDKIILWFEHDLYDQLQLLQILDWFHYHPVDLSKLSIICTEQYLGTLSATEMLDLYQYEEPITQQHLLISEHAWAAFRSNTPERWRTLLDIDTNVLPFLNGAIVRMLEEYPSCINGLSRTANQALKVISEGEKRPGYIFGANQELEDRMYLGDSSFWFMLHELLDSDPPMLELPPGKKLTLPTSPDQELTITVAGKDVLAGKKNWLNIATPDRWIGGVHLAPGHIWCWDSVSNTIKKRT